MSGIASEAFGAMPALERWCQFLRSLQAAQLREKTQVKKA
jgi:hypothetical protein